MGLSHKAKERKERKRPRKQKRKPMDQLAEAIRGINLSISSSSSSSVPRPPRRRRNAPVAQENTASRSIPESMQMGGVRLDDGDVMMAGESTVESAASMPVDQRPTGAGQDAVPHPRYPLRNRLQPGTTQNNPTDRKRMKSSVAGRNLYLPPEQRNKQKHHHHHQQPVSPPITPQPTTEYLVRANQAPRRLPSSQAILLIMDLNGTLIHRPNRAKSSTFTVRPEMVDFLEYIFGSGFAVMVWSSSRPANVEVMCRKLFTPSQHGLLVARWGRNQLGLTKSQYENKVQVYKRLEWVWNDEEIASHHPGYHSTGGGAGWNQSNTVLLDDSLLKGASQPYNILCIPEFVGGRAEKDGRQRPLMQVVRYLEALRWQDDVSAYMRLVPFVIEPRWREEEDEDSLFPPLPLSPTPTPLIE